MGTDASMGILLNIIVGIIGASSVAGCSACPLDVEGGGMIFSSSPASRAPILLWIVGLVTKRR